MTFQRPRKEGALGSLFSYCASRDENILTKWIQNGMYCVCLRVCLCAAATRCNENHMRCITWPA